ncbi:MAG: hypothetical protein WCP18_02410 [bacterium]
MITDIKKLEIGKYYWLWFRDDNREVQALKIMKVLSFADSGHVLYARVLDVSDGRIKNSCFAFGHNIIVADGPIPLDDEVFVGRPKGF